MGRCYRAVSAKAYEQLKPTECNHLLAKRFHHISWVENSSGMHDNIKMHDIPKIKVDKTKFSVSLIKNKRNYRVYG